MAKTSARKRPLTFDAASAFESLIQVNNELRFKVDRLQRDLDSLGQAHRKLKDGYIKHVHQSHLAIEARLAAAEWVAADVAAGPDVDPDREWE